MATASRNNTLFTSYSFSENKEKELNNIPDSTHTYCLRRPLERRRDGRSKCVFAARSHGRSASESAVDHVDIKIEMSVNA